MASKGTQRKLTAILCADVVGYSRLMGDDEEATIETLTAHRKVFISEIKKHRGRVVDAKGDAILAEFASVVDAVNGAVEIQRELGEKNTGLSDDRRMDFRIGINLGDVVLKDDVIYGDGVNIAARLEALAEPGGICISRPVFDQVESRLKLECEYLGEHEVKNIAEPVRAYRVLTTPGAAAHRVVGAKRALEGRWRKAAIAAGIVLILLIGAAGAVLVLSPTARFVVNMMMTPELPSLEKVLTPRAESKLPENPSIAVLPFTNLSNDPEQEVFADSLTEDIITGISLIPDLFVVARNSVFTYKGKAVDVRQVSRELGVRYVLEGSIRPSGERVRINVQLIDATTGDHLWAGRYDRSNADILAVQDEIMQAIVVELAIKLVEGEQIRFWARDSKSMEALHLGLKARKAFWVTSREGNFQTQQYLSQAIELEPDNALFYAALGVMKLSSYGFGWSPDLEETFREAVALANKALAMDESLPSAHLTMGYAYLWQGRHDDAIREMERGVALNPAGAEIAAGLAYVLVFSGEPERASIEIQRAFRLSPRFPDWQLLVLSQVYRYAGQREQSLAAIRELLRRNPEGMGHWPYLSLAITYAMMDRIEEAQAAAAEVLKRKPDFTVDEMDRLPYRHKIVLRQAKDLLRKAGLPE